MSAVIFVIPGQPVGKGRPRAVRAGSSVRMITPPKTREHERCVRLVAAEAFDGEPWSGPVRVDILALMKRPKRLRRRKAPDVMFCTSKPAADNIRKACLDGIQAAGVIGDDSQVVDGRTVKLYASKTGRPLTIVRMEQCAPVDNYWTDDWLYQMTEGARVAGYTLASAP